MNGGEVRIFRAVGGVILVLHVLVVFRCWHVKGGGQGHLDSVDFQLELSHRTTFQMKGMASLSLSLGSVCVRYQLKGAGGGPPVSEPG